MQNQLSLEAHLPLPSVWPYINCVTSEVVGAAASTSSLPDLVKILEYFTEKLGTSKIIYLKGGKIVLQISLNCCATSASLLQCIFYELLSRSNSIAAHELDRKLQSYTCVSNITMCQLQEQFSRLLEILGIFMK